MRRFRTTIAMALTILVTVIFGSAYASASSESLKIGSEGSSVTTLQKDLIKLGYLSSDPTGYYGDLTEQAVKKVQKEYGYKADGVAGETTLSLIDRILGKEKSSAGSSGLLKEGDENGYVKAMQSDLIALGFFDAEATGYFGPATKEALMKLQKKNGYKADGIAGSSTLALIDKLVAAKNKAVKAAEMKAPAEVLASAAADESVKPAAESTSVTQASIAVSASVTGDKDTAAKPKSDKTSSDYALKWFGKVEDIFARGETATVYDIETGKSFRIKRTYGSNHADCETLTKNDTAIMKKIYDGTWSWDRRAIIVEVDGLKIAACMTGYPHAGSDRYAANRTLSSRSGGYGRGTNLDAVKGNNMSGVFDIHFLGSRNHYNNRIDPKHQALVKEAAAWAVKHY
ncbi:MAG TPA: peptidoglycan-binding protein [Clostridia bacterium]|nr:peptidoglycan-binding protein [Clostridia bacterium]